MNFSSFASSLLQVPPGYEAADFGLDGQVFESQQPGTIPLQLWYNATINDHLTVARCDLEV